MSKKLFTRREQEIMQHLELSPKEISELLYIELTTVKSHIYNLCKKAKVHSQRALLSFYFNKIIYQKENEIQKLKNDIVILRTKLYNAEHTSHKDALRKIKNYANESLKCRSGLCLSEFILKFVDEGEKYAK